MVEILGKQSSLKPEFSAAVTSHQWDHEAKLSLVVPHCLHSKSPQIVAVSGLVCTRRRTHSRESWKRPGKKVRAPKYLSNGRQRKRHSVF